MYLKGNLFNTSPVLSSLNMILLTHSYDIRVDVMLFYNLIQQRKHKVIFQNNSDCSYCYINSLKINLILQIIAIFLIHTAYFDIIQLL